MRLAAALSFFLACCVSSARAADALMSAKVVDDDGKPVESAIVFLYDVQGGKYPPPEKPYEMAQEDKEFVPGLLTVLAGGKVSFPNRDTVLHHVYSFSKTKTFELPLYKGKTAEPVVFDKPGVVKVGCNIHDWMRGTILVLPTPYFARTDKEGRASLKIPRGGKRQFAVFHERLRGSVDATLKDVSLKDEKSSAKWEIRLRKERRQRARKSY